jgi:hypothetical protein
MKSFSLMFSVAAMAAMLGCGTSSESAVPTTAVNIDGSKFLLNEEPDGALGVIAARETAEDGKPLVMVGRIGGTANPWIDGRAAFTVLDASMTVVAESEDMAEGAICTEECCDAERATCTALVKIVDPQGSIVSVDSRQLLGVKESDMVVVQGRAQKDDKGNFVMLADRVYIRE